MDNNEIKMWHWIFVDERNRIIDARSDDPGKHFSSPGAILYNDEGDYFFKLLIDGEWVSENLFLRDSYDVPLYKWDGKAVQRRTQQEIEADRPEAVGLPPDPMLELAYRMTLLEAELGYMDNVDELRESGRLSTKQIEALDAVVEEAARKKESAAKS